MRKKILAVASMGGHWKQLYLLIQSLGYENVSFYKAAKFKDEVENDIGYLPDANKSNPFKLILLLMYSLKIILIERPNVIISTGAAPGVILMFAAKMLAPGCTLIWIDSIANGEQLSLSGKIAKKITKFTFSQWEDVALKNGVIYKGRIIS